jgi:hypothetical protein
MVRTNAQIWCAAAAFSGDFGKLPLARGLARVLQSNDKVYEMATTVPR